MLLNFQFVVIFFICFIFTTSAYYKRLQLSCDQIRQFVDGHNLRRFQIAQGMIPGQPSAYNMNFMVWDEELAEKAAKWAEHGIFGHNPDRTINSRRWELIGENVYQAKFYSNINIEVTPDITEALDSWFNEHYGYGFEPYKLKSSGTIGHYTQMVWADSSQLGCGISQRKEFGWTTTLFVCNYGPTGNFIGHVPYRSDMMRRNLQCTNGLCNMPYGKYCS